METLTASSMKGFLENLRDKDRGFFCPALKDCLFSRSEIRILGFPKHVNCGFSLSVSIPARKTIHAISSASALSSSETTETGAGDEEMQQTPDTTQTKTVHVKFQLQRECSFGQQFLIVGDDPMFGLWDPSNAVPLTWSEGHVWTVELDMPCDKLIKYKFILKGSTDAILWQPGPDRVLQSWETGKTITVSEDWENEGLQTIAEEDPVPDKITESLEDSAAMIVTENLPQPGGDPWSDMNVEPNSKKAIYPKSTEIPFADKPMAIVAENITEQNGELEVNVYGISRERIAKDASNFVIVGASDFENNALSINGENFTLSKNEENLDSGVGIPVLVPGLAPTAETEEASVTELDKDIESDASFGSDKAEEFSVPELNLEEENSTCLPIPEVQEKGHVEKPQLVEHNNDQPNKETKNDVLENDIQWGQRTLQRILMILGLLKQNAQR